jgi:tRNA(fMet)-specific endonuclease VapC
VTVVDADVLIDAVQLEVEPARSRVEALLRAGDLAVSAVTAFELAQGSRTPGWLLERLSALLDGATVLPLTRGAADVAAALNRHLEARGERIGGPDTLVAGTCLERGCPILTRNVRHFARVPGLEVQEPG